MASLRLISAIAAFFAFPTLVSAGTIDDVRARDRLICGVSEGLPGFSDRDSTGAWQGFDVDLCRAVAIAVLGDPDKVDYVPLSAAQRFDALKGSKVDLLSRNTTWTMSRDLNLGVDFAGVAYYDGQGFMSRAAYGVRSALELEGARICVITGTTTEENAAAYFGGKGIEVTFMRFDTRTAAREAYAAERCDAFTADRSALAAERSLLAVPDDHVILPEVISKEPLGPATRDNDPAWTDLVRWTLYGLINAEERRLTSAGLAPTGTGSDARRGEAIAMGKPAAASLHLSDDWLLLVLTKVGNYGEIFDRNLGSGSPLAIERGINAPWNAGGILYAPPMQ